MYQDSFAAGEPGDGLHIDLPALDIRKPPRLAALFSGAVSLTLLIAVALQFRNMELGRIRETIPVSAGFWLTFAGYYLAAPAGDWIIYRRLWRIPPSAMGALLRKLVSNELLLGYLGEAQFYAWVRARRKLAAAPFGAIKDVTILSALTGNVATIALLVCAWPLIFSGVFGVEMRTTVLSLGIVLVTSFLILLFRRKLFTLPRRELWFIAGVHGARIAAMLGLAALMWHMVLPEVSIALWLVLATLRMLVSRLPLIPNKDVVFAGLAAFLMVNEVQIASLMAMMAAMLLVVHLCVGAICAAADLVSESRTQ